MEQRFAENIREGFRPESRRRPRVPVDALPHIAARGTPPDEYPKVFRGEATPSPAEIAAEKFAEPLFQGTRHPLPLHVMRVALCQINPIVGDIDGNAAKVVEVARAAHEKGAEFAVLPELAICGYPPRDLLDRASFVDRAEDAVGWVAARVPRALTVVVGAVRRTQGSGKRRVQNVACVLRQGTLAQTIAKRLLPTYDVFDEDRYFDPARTAPPLVEIAGRRVGITICEDAWSEASAALAPHTYDIHPVAELVDAGAELVVNISASPFTLPKRVGRPTMLAGLARRHGVPVVFVNQVGGNDDLVFDGRSSVYGPDGSLWARAASFASDVVICDFAKPGTTLRPEPATDVESALEALTLGTRDYARKCGFRSSVLGLSGGVDSALTACIAARALGPQHVLGVALPSRYSSEGSLTDARALADALAIDYRVISIDRIFQSYLDELGPALDAIAAPGPADVTLENIQSRIRCAVLMAISNRAGALLLTTGNKSEIAVGYCTLYGDMAGGLAVISDLPKGSVYTVAHEVNRQAGRLVIPESTMTKPPSAELRPNQTDQDSLPPYEILDAVLERYVEDGRSAEEIVADGFDAAVVHRIVRMIATSEYKRRQMAPGLIVTRKAFGIGRRYPIAQKFAG